LLIAAASARQKYVAYLDEKNKKKLADTNEKKRKLVFDEVEKLKIKKLTATKGFGQLRNVSKSNGRKG